MSAQKRNKIYALGFRSKATTLRYILSFAVILFAFFSFHFSLLADVTTGSTTSVSVPPQAPDYQLAISGNVGGGPVSQGTEITYTITYGASSSAAFTTDDTITVDFNQDTSDGVTHVADYVYNSATSGFGGAVPIVDLVNRKITWNISQMPVGTMDQIVTFKMKTNSQFTVDSYQIPMITTTSFSNQYVNFQKSMTITYGFHVTPASPTTPTPSPTPLVTPSITPTPTLQPLTINSIQVKEITANTLTLSIGTTKKTRLRAFYGVSPHAMFQLASDTTPSAFHTMQLTKLTPQTKYFVQLVATDESGNNVISDILAFTTAKTSSPLAVDQQSVILVSGNNPLINENPSLPFVQVELPNNQAFTIGLRISTPKNVKNIVALVQNAHVLGVNTFSNNESMLSTPMTEQQPGVFIAQLAAPATPSTYDVFAQISDTFGNITQTKIAEATVYGPLHIIDAGTSKSIEHARIFLEYYNSHKKSYEPILSSDIQENPIFSDKNGFAIINSGTGKYKVSVSQYNYKPQTVYFTIDKSHIYPPTIKLRNIGFTVSGMTQFYTNTALDFLGRTFKTLQGVSSATRFFQLISAVVLISLVILTFLLFLIRTKLPLIVIPLFIKHHTQRIGSVHGQIVDAVTRRPIPMAVIAVSNKISHEVLTTTTSSNKGVFYLKNEWVSADNNLNILAQGYRTNKFAINEELFPAVIYLHHNLVGGPLHHPFIASIINLAGTFFETLLVASFVLEIFFIPTIGPWSIIFAGISLFNLFLWILYHRETLLF